MGHDGYPYNFVEEQLREMSFVHEEFVDKVFESNIKILAENYLKEFPNDTTTNLQH